MREACLFSLAVALTLSACANSPPQTAPRDSQNAPVPPAADFAPPAAPVEAAPPVALAVEAGTTAAVVDAAASPALASPSAIDAAQWFAARGVATLGPKLSLELSECTAVQVGTPARDALLCIGGPPMEGSLTGGQSLFPLVVAFADVGKVRVALRVPIGAGPLTKMAPPQDDPNRGNYVQLVASVSADGARLTISDRPGAGCDERLASYRDRNAHDPMVKGVLGPHLRVMETACRSRGEYAWRGSQFAR